MAADVLPVTTGVLRDQRRSLVVWSLALAAVSAMYIAFWPAMDTGDIQALVDSLPEGLRTAMGYDAIGTPAGYLTSTVYGLLGPALLLVFAIGTGARLLAGLEEDGTLELELVSPVSRRRVYLERLGALTTDLVALVLVLMVVTLVLVAALDMEVAAGNIVAGSTGLFLLVLAHGAVAFAVGAATGRRSQALGAAAGLAVTGFVLDAIGPTVGWGWMTSVSPFSWLLVPEPLAQGFDLGFVRLVLLAGVAGVAGMAAFERRDLMV
jgi:ABC-2 type transport system permease protein